LSYERISYAYIYARLSCVLSRSRRGAASTLPV